MSLNNDFQAEDPTTLLPCRSVYLSVSVAIIHPTSPNCVAANTFLRKGDEGHHKGHVTGITLHVTAVVEKAQFEERDLRTKTKAQC